MAHRDIKSDCATSYSAKMASMGVGGAIKHAMAAHDKQMHGGKHTNFANGGIVGDAEPGHFARGGSSKGKGKKGKGGAHVNVIVAPQTRPEPPALPHGLGMGPPRPPIPPMLPPAAAGGMPPGGPPPMMMPPGGAAPQMMGGPPVGALPKPPMMMPPRKSGGRVGYAGGGRVNDKDAKDYSWKQGADLDVSKRIMGPQVKHKADGQVKRAKGGAVIEHAAGGGLGRLEKIDAYGGDSMGEKASVAVNSKKIGHS